MNSILIDGNNLIHKMPSIKKMFVNDKEAARKALIELVNSRLGNKVKILFVFDGHGKSSETGVLFSRDRTADDVIREKIEKEKEHKKLTVVSSDTNISSLAKICGCNAVSSEEFRKKLEANSNAPGGKNINQNYIYDELEKPERMSKREIDEFRKYFT